MKRFLNIFLLALIAICCDKENTTPDTPAPDPRPDNITLASGTDTAPVVPENGGAITVSFTANTAWTATVSSGSDWCIVTPASGNAGSASITITAKENTTGDIRTASVVVKAGTASQSIAVVQKPKTPDSITLAAGTNVNPVISTKGDTLSVSFTSNASWTATVEGNNDWCIVTPSSGSAGNNSIIIAVKDNQGYETRSATVVIQAGTASETIKIEQQPRDPDKITFATGTNTSPAVSADGGAVTISFTTNVSWEAAVTTSNAEWCKVTPSSGAAGNGTITITVEKNTTANARYANVRIIAGGAIEWISLEQQPRDPDKITFAAGTNTSPVVSADGGKITISFTTNVAWESSVEGNADWCKVVPASGAAGNGTITITVDKNTTTNMRYATVRVKAGDAYEWISVQQNKLTGNEGIKPGEALP